MSPELSRTKSETKSLQEKHQLSRQGPDMFRVIAGVILLGSIWGLLECTLGGINIGIGAIALSMGSIMTGIFGIGFMLLAMKMFRIKGVALSVALIAGVLRFFAPVGSCIICSSIAIMAEGVIFEIIMNRPSFSLNRVEMKDVRRLAFLGVIIAYTIYVSGYMITQIMTPLVAGEAVVAADVARVLPLALGRGFFAAFLGGMTMPAVVLSPQLNINVNKVKREYYYTASTATSALCWVIVLVFHFWSIF